MIGLRRLRSLLGATAVGLFVFVPASQAAVGSPASAELETLYRARDYFGLRERLGPGAESFDETVEVRFYRAVLAHAFNRPEASNRILDGLEEAPELPPALAVEIPRLAMENSLRRQQYRDALRAARRVLDAPAGAYPKALREDVANTARLLEALADVPPQEVELRGTSRLALGKSRRLPVTIGGNRRRFGLDTGANFSVLMRSEARALGLTVLAAGIEVGTSTGSRELADVAVADRMRIGRIEYRHVVFLVLPDELLTFPDGERIPGLVGFPLVEAMGEIRFHRDDVLEVLAEPPRRRLGNLALEGLEPLVRVRYSGDALLCRLDTGAGRSVFYEPFYRRYRARLDAAGKRLTVTAGGVGGMRQLEALRLAKLVVTVAAASVTLRGVEVFTQPLRRPEENFLHCNLGLDVLESFKMYAINFRDMALVVR